VSTAVAPLRGAGPSLVTAVVALAVLITAPAVADLAAHTYRADLWAREGFVVWNANWYGGHHVPGYSLLFPPLGAWLGVRVVGGLAAVAAVWIFGRITPHRGAQWLFASGVAANLVSGRMPFVLGVAFATAAWAAADRASFALALNSSEKPRKMWLGGGALSAAATLASPVAGVFLVGLALARARSRALLIIPAMATGLALGVLFPEGGTERFVATAFWPMFALSLAAVAALQHRFRAAALLNAAVLLAAFLLPTAMGQNAVRAGALLLPVALVLGARRGAPQLVLVAALTYLAWLPAVRAVVEAHDDPSARRSFYAEVKAITENHRTEVVFTHNHWEAAYLADSTPIARGWERQVDRKVNGLFYDEAPLTAERYRAWLSDNGVEFVALPTAELDYSAQQEAELLTTGVPGLQEVHRSSTWRIWSTGVIDPTVHLAPDRIRVKGPTATNERWTRYWRVARGDAEIEERDGRLSVDARGEAVVAARLGR
jgi:hypothetical protein